MAVMFDHDVTDGAPVARFMKRLQELMTSGYGLATAPMGDIHDQTIDLLRKYQVIACCDDKYSS